MARADETLAEAAASRVPAEQFVQAHQAAMYAAAALVAARGAASTQPATIWQALAEVEPSLAQSAGQFAAATRKRAAADAGLPRAVSASDAADMLRDAKAFVAAACLAGP